MSALHHLDIDARWRAHNAARLTPKELERPSSGRSLTKAQFGLLEHHSFLLSGKRPVQAADLEGFCSLRMEGNHAIDVNVKGYQICNVLGKGGVRGSVKVLVPPSRSYSPFRSQAGTLFDIHQGSKVMAFKVFVPHRRDTDESFRINAQRECTILRYLKSIRTSTLGHNLQISLSDSFENPNSHPQRDYFVMTELMDFTLAAVIEGSKADFRPSLVQNFMAQMLNGLSDLNSHHVIHRDLKPANILIRKTSTGYLVQLADFGLAYWDALPMADKNLKWHGDPGYRSPEALEATIRGYAGEQRGASGFPECADPELDCWALGCVLLDLLSKKAEGFTAVVPHNPADGPRPPLGIRTAANQALIRRMNLPVFLGTDQTRFNTLPLDIQCRLPWSKRDAYGTDLFTLLRMLLEEDPHKRWTVKEALAFPFIASVVHPLLRYHSLEKYSPDHRRGIRAKVLERRLLV